MWVIQQRHFLFRWLWVDAWVNSLAGAACSDTFFTPEDAERALPFFDGTKVVERIYKEGRSNG